MGSATPTSAQTNSGKKSIVAHLNTEGVRAVIYQVIVVGLVILAGWYLVSNTLANLERQSISTGYGYLNLEASFGISETMIAYSPADSYGQALVVGLLNTVKVSLLGILLATLLGVVFGIARLSENWIVRKVATVYVDMFRNIPVLLQLVFWYAVINASFPKPKQALNPFGDVFLSNRGVFVPVPESHPVFSWMAVAALVGIVAAFVIRAWATKRQERTGEQFPYITAGFGIVVLFVVVTYFLGGAPTGIDAPVLKGFNFKGGWQISPEFAAVLIGLTVYTSTYIAEVVRSGIQAVPSGQWEAARSVGLRESLVMRFVVLPQSMRVTIPPLTNQYLNLTKNSSLAVAVGYPDLVSISNTTMNQTGQAIEAISIFMAIYLSLSILISLFMNWYNKKMALVER